MCTVQPYDCIAPNNFFMGNNSLVKAALVDWQRLLVDMKARPTHVNELAPQTISDVANMGAAGSGTGGAWMSTTGAYQNTCWRVEWPQQITDLVVSDGNPTGSITNSDLEMAAILLS